MLDRGEEPLARQIAVEADHVGPGEHHPIDAVAPLSGPRDPHEQRRGERLVRVGCLRPVEDLLQQLGRRSVLVRRPVFDVVDLGAVRLVEHVPAVDAWVAPVAAEHFVDIRAQRGPERGIRQDLRAGRLQPHRVVRTRARLALRAERRHRIPAAVEQHGHRGDAMRRRDVEHLVETGPEARHLGEQVMEEQPDAVHPEVGRPAELAIDRLRVVGGVLEHLELIAAGRGHEVAAHKPAHLVAPGLRPLPAPARLRAQRWRPARREGAFGHVERVMRELGTQADSLSQHPPEAIASACRLGDPPADRVPRSRETPGPRATARPAGR